MKSGDNVIYKIMLFRFQKIFRVVYGIKVLNIYILKEK